jgi:hypothetical protein
MGKEPSIVGRRARERRTMYDYPAGTIDYKRRFARKVGRILDVVVRIQTPTTLFRPAGLKPRKGRCFPTHVDTRPSLRVSPGSRLSWMCTLLYLLSRCRAHSMGNRPYIVGKRAKGLRHTIRDGG